eukprot:9045560-Pyramimonas_sp.AAC.1
MNIVHAPETAFWNHSGLPGRNNYVHGFAVESQQWCSGTIPDRQDVRVRLTRGVEILRVMFWHASRCSHGCPPTGQSPQWQ